MASIASDGFSATCPSASMMCMLAPVAGSMCCMQRAPPRRHRFQNAGQISRALPWIERRPCNTAVMAYRYCSSQAGGQHRGRRRSSARVRRVRRPAGTRDLLAARHSGRATADPDRGPRLRRGQPHPADRHRPTRYRGVHALPIRQRRSLSPMTCAPSPTPWASTRWRSSACPAAVPTPWDARRRCPIASWRSGCSAAWRPRSARTRSAAD